MVKRKQTIKILKEFEQGEYRVLLVKDEKLYAVIKARTVHACVVKKYQYGDANEMKKLFNDLVNELKKGAEYGREN